MLEVGFVHYESSRKLNEDVGLEIPSGVEKDKVDGFTPHLNDNVDCDHSAHRNTID